MSLEEFKSKFNFDKNKTFMVGVERECFLQNGSKQIVPIASKVIKHISGSESGNDRFGYELSACQLEDRTKAVKIKLLKTELLHNEAILKQAEKKLGFERLFYEIGPSNMPLDIYPDPKGRYQEIAKKLPRDILKAGCRVIGTHIHIGMPNHASALKAYNYAINFIDDLCRLGNNSNGKRLKLYSLVEKELPPVYTNWEAFYEKAKEKSFSKNPRDCWHLIRVSRNGTIEFRVFGATKSIDRICLWAGICLNICQNALSQ